MVVLHTPLVTAGPANNTKRFFHQIQNDRAQRGSLGERRKMGSHAFGDQVVDFSNAHAHPFGDRMGVAF